jgi:hypothetical protein
MRQRVVIAPRETTFCAVCDVCGTAFAGRLDEDLVEGVFLCRDGHSILIVRAADDPARVDAAADAA